MISASGGNGILFTPILNSLVLELIFFFLYLYSFDGTAFAVKERMTKNRSALSRTLSPFLTVHAHPCVISDLRCGMLSIAIVSTAE